MFRDRFYSLLLSIFIFGILMQKIVDNTILKREFKEIHTAYHVSTSINDRFYYVGTYEILTERCRSENKKYGFRF